MAILFSFFLSFFFFLFFSHPLFRATDFSLSSQPSPRNTLASPRPLSSNFQKFTDGPSRQGQVGVGRGKPNTLPRNSTPAQRKPLAPMDSRFKDTSAAPPSNPPRPPRTLTPSPLLSSRQSYVPRPQGDGFRYPNQQPRTGQYPRRTDQPWSAQRRPNDRSSFSGRGGRGGGPGGRRPRRTGSDFGSAMLNDSIFDEPERGDDLEVSLDSYLSSDEVHPLRLNDYYSPAERLPFHTFRLAEE